MSTETPTAEQSAHLTKTAYILGIALVLGLAILGSSISQSRDANTITVTGSVKKEVLADLGVWHGTLLVNADLYNTKEKLGELAQETKRVQALATTLGFPADALVVDPVQSGIVYEQLPNYQQSQKPIGYTLRQAITVTSKDLKKIADLSQRQTALIADGVVFDYTSTEYHVSTLADLRPQLFADATKDAQVRAQAIASGTGARIGALRSARTGVIQVLAPHSNDISDYGTYDLSSQQKEISAVVTASFELKN